MKTIFKTILLMGIILGLGSCSIFSPKEKPKIPKTIFSNDKIENLEIKAELDIDMPDMSNSVNSTIQLVKKDSLLMDIFGPFSIHVAKLFSSEEEFIFYNIFQNELISGKPNKENFLRATNLNLSFDELIHLIRNEVPGNSEDYNLFSTDDKSNKTYLNSSQDDDIYITYDDKYNKLIKYEQKSKENEKLLSINYSNYNPINNFLMPSTIEIVFEKLGGSLKILVEEYKINEGFGTISFTKPKSAKEIKLD